MSTESELKRYRDQAARLRGEISRHSSTVAAKRKKAADAQASASRSKSSSTIRSKLREAETANRAANTAESKRADAEKKAAATEKKIADLQTKYEKEQRVQVERSLTAIRKASAASNAQFAGVPRVRPASPAQPMAAAQSDVFLSHASEDKEEIARPLREALEDRGLVVWFDEVKIKVGQSIRQEIEKGIAGAKFGVVILSPSFFAKQLTQAELDALFTKKVDTGRSIILPIWHRVTKDEVAAHSPLLAGLLALNSATMTVAEIADAIVEAVEEAG
ncbi:toll/interleukin-1 receptor domain-containing protein [Propionibacterium freudenreichii]|uniref:toll/interleukin-1 receptor domain-containing protein n=1 Tax=Propionibacterium freudenreichii TaxID=1744 RepID=UPI002551139B|nr:toll/interleukin-1 receptor domain-containing protein [Propionibacterium freudenreichii]MDK9657152.1 toll/interleukin-1 receptor domain-containing protein [Propionibacterium freudenreichii]